MCDKGVDLEGFRAEKSLDFCSFQGHKGHARSAAKAVADQGLLILLSLSLALLERFARC